MCAKAASMSAKDATMSARNATKTEPCGGARGVRAGKERLRGAHRTENKGKKEKTEGPEIPKIPKFRDSGAVSYSTVSPGGPLAARASNRRRCFIFDSFAQWYVWALVASSALVALLGGSHGFGHAAPSLMVAFWALMVASLALMVAS